MKDQPEDALAGMVVDPSSPVPVYYQIYEELRSQVGTHRMPVGSRLATERTIAAALGVSRQSVRQALARLEREGLVSRRQGDGTYVSEARLDKALNVSGFTSNLSARGLRVRSAVLDLRLCVPPPAVAEELGIGTSSESAVMLRRARSLDGVPATLETAWMPAALCAPLLDLNMTNRSLYTTLQERLGIVPAHATEHLTATVLDDFEASQLGQHRGDAALLVERVTRDMDGRNFEFVKALMRADRFTFRAELDLTAEPVVSTEHTALIDVPTPDLPREGN
jgi:GntR family transcriptional regulator